jgi:branched-chain amino acid transport system permease protein
MSGPMLERDALVMQPAVVPPFRVARSSPMHKYVLIVGVLAVVGLATVPFWGGESTTRTLVTFLYLVALGQMWNLLGGFAGLISVGQQGYIGIGAYGMWLLGDVLHIHPFACVFLSGILAVIIALPAAPLLFRLRGGYFAIGTWVVAEVLRIVVSNISATGGGSGKTVSSVAQLAAGGRTTWINNTYWIALFVAIGSILLVFFLLRSRLGLALTSIRDNDLASQSSGVNVFRSKLFVYVVSAYGCGVIGGVVALNLLFIQPAAAFSINWTAYAIFIVVIGGFGSIEGPIIGAIIYFGLLQTLSEYGTWYMMLLGVLAVVMATKAPRGIWGFVDKKWGLHLFPVRRRLAVEGVTDKTPKKKGATGDDEVASAEPA